MLTPYQASMTAWLQYGANTDMETKMLGMMLSQALLGIMFVVLFHCSKDRGTNDVTRVVVDAVNESDIYTGICSVFIHHSSTSLIITENGIYWINV